MSERNHGHSLGVYPDTDFENIRITIGPPVIWHPDKGYVRLDSLTDEDCRRISDGKSPYVTLASNDDES